MSIRICLHVRVSVVRVSVTNLQLQSLSNIEYYSKLILFKLFLGSVSTLLDMKCSPEDFKRDNYDIECVRENADQQGICKGKL